MAQYDDIDLSAHFAAVAESLARSAAELSGKSADASAQFTQEALDTMHLVRRIRAAVEKDMETGEKLQAVLDGCDDNLPDGDYRTGFLDALQEVREGMGLVEG